MNAVTKIAAAGAKPLPERVASYDWDAVGADLDAFGCTVLRNLLTPDECRGLAALYPQGDAVRVEPVSATQIPW
jgi:uncharacterized protein